MYFKGALQSITIWAGLIVSVLGMVGIVTSEADITDLASHVEDIITAALGILTILGRIRAKSQINGLF